MPHLASVRSRLERDMEQAFIIESSNRQKAQEWNRILLSALALSFAVNVGILIFSIITHHRG